MGGSRRWIAAVRSPDEPIFLIAASDRIPVHPSPAVTRPKHHYVPEMMSRRFAGPEGLWFFDTNKPGREVHPRNPGSIFFVRDYNSFFNTDGTKHEEAERFLGRIENDTSQLLDRIIDHVRREQVPQLTPVERSMLTTFVYLMWKRPPETRAWFVSGVASPKSFQEYAIDFEQEFKRPLNETEVQLLQSPVVRERLIQNALVTSLMNFETKALPAINNCGLHYGRAVDGRSFIVGSRPVLRVGPELGSTHAAIVMPVAHDVIVQFGHRSFEGRGRDLTDPVVRQTNETIWSQSSSIAGSSRAQIESLARLPLQKAKKENARRRKEHQKPPR